VLGRRNVPPKTPRPNTQDPTPKTQHQRYNTPVPAPERNDESSQEHHRHRVYASETTGLLLIAFLLLVLTLIRFWHDIHWSLR
jgi:hypothetical protein